MKGGVQSAGGSGLNVLPESGTLSPLGSPSAHNRFEPQFDTMIPRNVTALVGKSAYLSCRVRNLGNKTVSPFSDNISFCFSFELFAAPKPTPAMHGVACDSAWVGWDWMCAVCSFVLLVSPAWFARPLANFIFYYAPPLDKVQRFGHREKKKTHLAFAVCLYLSAKHRNDPFDLLTFQVCPPVRAHRNGR